MKREDQPHGLPFASGNGPRTLLQSLLFAIVAPFQQLDRTAEILCQTAVECLGGDYGNLVLLNSHDSQGRVAVEYPTLGTLGNTVLLDKAFTERLLEDQEPLSVTGTKDKFQCPLQSVFQQLGIQSALITSVVSKERRLIGFFCLGYSAPARQFNQLEAEQCKLLAACMATAAGRTSLPTLVSVDREEDTPLASPLPPVVVIDQNSRIVTFTEPAEEMFGWESEEMIGHSVVRLWQDVGRAKEISDEIHQKNAVVGKVIELKHRDGTPFRALLCAATIKDAFGDPGGQVGFIISLRELALLEERLSLLIRVSRLITGTLDLDEVLDRIIGATLEAFPRTQNGTIHLFNERDGFLHVRATARNYSPEAIDALRLKPGEGIAGWVYEHRQPKVVTDAGKDPQYKRIDHPEVKVHKAMLCVPLQVKERAIGTLTLSSDDEANVFLPEDEILLTPFAEQATIAIENARQMRELREIRKAAEALARVDDPSKALEQIVESAVSVLRADSSVIWPYDAVKDKFVPEELVATGVPRDELEGFRDEEHQPGRTAREVMRQGYVAVEDVSQPAASFLGEPSRKLLGRIGAQSFQGIVLRAETEELGVLYVNYNRARKFDEGRKSTLETFANHAALALKSARLLQKVRAARDAAELVAEASVLEGPSQVLDTIVKNTRAVLDCDAVVLYSYDQERDRLGYPPKMAGVRYPDRVTRDKEVCRESIIFEMLWEKEPYIAEDVCEDPLFKDRRFVKDEGIKTCVAAPLDVMGTKVGVMFINFRSPRCFAKEKEGGELRRNINLSAFQAAVAIRNVQLYDREKKGAASLKALYEAGKIITDACALDESLNRIVKQAWQLIKPHGEKIHFSHLALMNGRVIEFVAAHPPEMLERLHEKVQKIDLDKDSPIGITGRVTADGQSQLVGNVRGHPDYLETDPNVRSQLGVPIKRKEQVIGVINVEHPDLNAFQEEDRQTLESLAAQAAITIDNARLLNDLQQDANRLKCINLVAAEVCSSLDFDQVIRNIQNLIGELAKGIEAKQSTYVEFDEHKESGSAFPQIMAKGGPLFTINLREDPIIKEVCDTRRAVVIENVREDSRIGGSRQTLIERNTESVLVVPVVVGNEAIGFIALETNVPRCFTENEVQLAEIVAHHTAIAIQNAKLYEELKHANKLVKARTTLVWMNITTGLWQHKIPNYVFVAQSKASDLRESLLTILQHKEYAQAVNDLDKIVESLTSIQEYTPFQVFPPDGEKETSSICLGDLVSERVNQLWEKEPYKNYQITLQLSLGEAYIVQVIPELLCQAFDILIDNAIDAIKGCDEQKVHVNIQLMADDRIGILVSDTGAGIPDGLHHKLGWEPITQNEGANGSGVGLVMANLIAQAFGGEISIVSTGPVGTTMAILLPFKRFKQEA